MQHLPSIIFYTPSLHVCHFKSDYKYTIMEKFVMVILGSTVETMKILITYFENALL